VHGDVGAAVEQRVLQLFDEDAVAADRRDGAHGVAIAPRRHAHDLDGMTLRLDRGGHETRLDHREGAGTGRDAKCAHGDRPFGAAKGFYSVRRQQVAL